MGSIFSATTEGEEALAAATQETVLQLRGSASAKAAVIQWSVAFDSTSGTAEPVLVRLIRQSSDGTGSAATEAEWDEDGPEALLSAFHSFSAEPSTGEVLEEHLVHPQAGIVIQYPLGREPKLSAATTSRLGIAVNAPAVVNAVATIVWEE